MALTAAGERTTPGTPRSVRTHSGARSPRPRVLLGVLAVVLLGALGVVLLAPRLVPGGSASAEGAGTPTARTPPAGTVPARSAAPGTAARAPDTSGSAGASNPTTAVDVPHGKRSAGDHPPSRRAAPDWASVLAGLDERRSRAFATGDSGLLRAVYAPGAPAGKRDEALLARLEAHGARARGLHSTVLTARSAGVERQRAVVRVTDLLEPYEIVAADARVQRSVPGRGARTWTLTLVRSAGQWQVYDVQRTTA